MEPEITHWIASILLNGGKAEHLRLALEQFGFAPEAVEKELADAAPYIAMVNKLRKRLDLRESLLKTLDRQMREVPGYTAVEKVKFPPFKAFLQQYCYPNRLGVFSGVLDNCEARNWTPQRILEKVGSDSVVEIQEGIATGGRHGQSMKKYAKKVKFGDFITRVENTEFSNDFYMIAYNSEPSPALDCLKKDMEGFGDGEYLAPEDTRGRIAFWIGPKGTVTALHYDYMNSLFVQVYGRKLFRLIPAMQVPYMYNMADEGHKRLSEVDLLNPQFDLYPDFQKITVIEVEVGPGDCIFIPIGWWHHVTALSTSISLSCTNINMVGNNRFVDFGRES